MTPVVILNHTQCSASELHSLPESYESDDYLFGTRKVDCASSNSPTSPIKPHNPHGNVRSLSTESGATFATALSHNSRMDWTVTSHNENTDPLSSDGDEDVLVVGLNASFNSKMSLVPEEKDSIIETKHENENDEFHASRVGVDHDYNVEMERKVPTSVQIHRSRIPICAMNSLLSTDSGRELRRVSFHEVKIRKYPMIVGDNPACQMGAPVTLDWGFEELPPLDLDDFEAMRSLTRRRKLHHLLLNYFQRRRILAGMGFTEEEIKHAEKDAGKFRRQRDVTRLFLPISKLQEIVQSLCRKTKRRMNKAERDTKEEFHETIRKLLQEDAKRILTSE